MEITFMTGLMGSGKSAKLIEQFKKDKTKRIALAARFDDYTGTRVPIKSRNGQSIEALALNREQSKEIEKLIRLLAYFSKINTIYIDEVQFLTSEQLSSIILQCKLANVNVHLFGLSLTFTGELFRASEWLLQTLPEESIYDIEAKCEEASCDNLADYNARIINGKIARSGSTFVEEKSTYKTLCEKHFFMD